jgi:hypothetical protein
MNNATMPYMQFPIPPPPPGFQNNIKAKGYINKKKKKEKETITCI